MANRFIFNELVHDYDTHFKHVLSVLKIQITNIVMHCFLPFLSSH